jgi:hypothetical protein
LRLNFGYASVRDIRIGIRTIAQLIGRPPSRLDPSNTAIDRQTD